MGTELLVAEEVWRWFQWLVAADPDAAGELAAAADAYARDPGWTEEPFVLDICLSTAPRGLAFVAAHVEGAVFLASGAEVGASVRRLTTLVRRALKVVRAFQRGRAGLRSWMSVRGAG